MSDSVATLRDLDEIARSYSVVFPTEFAAHICGRFPGIYIEVKDTVWPRPKAYDVGPFWSFLYGLHTLTPCATSLDWMRIDYNTAKFQESTGHKCAPILKLVGDANVYCVDSDGFMRRYDHETNELASVEGDFWSVFEREIIDLKNRKVRKINE